MLKEIKEAIENNKEVKEALQGCSDDFILQNASLIYKALSNIDVFDGYKVRIWVEDEKLNWDYAPTKESTIKEEKSKKVASKYTYKLPSGQESLYLIDLNQITWTDDKKDFAIKCKELVKELSEGNNPKGYWMKGKTNSGKTFASIALLNTLAKKGYSVAYVNIGSLVSQVNETMSSWDESYSIIIEQINRAKIIVIDDFGVQKTTTWFNENVLIPILEYRGLANKTTIFTSNVGIEELKSKLEFRVEFKKDDMETNEKLISKLKQLIDKEMRIG